MRKLLIGCHSGASEWARAVRFARKHHACICVQRLWIPHLRNIDMVLLALQMLPAGGAPFNDSAWSSTSGLQLAICTAALSSRPLLSCSEALIHCTFANKPRRKDKWKESPVCQVLRGTRTRRGPSVPLLSEVPISGRPARSTGTRFQLEAQPQTCRLPKTDEEELSAGCLPTADL